MTSHNDGQILAKHLIARFCRRAGAGKLRAEVDNSSHNGEAEAHGTRGRALEFLDFKRPGKGISALAAKESAGVHLSMVR